MPISQDTEFERNRLLHLSADEVEVIQVDLNPPDAIVAAYRQRLSADEQRRADRFVTAELTRRSIVCRGVLRRLLSTVLKIHPEEIGFVTGPHGKPAVVPEQSQEVEFNVSHSRDTALIAIARRIVGVDVEAVDDKTPRDELAARFFSEIECRDYFSLPAELRTAAFYRLWTCKEAYIKATGQGLSLPLGQFSVASLPDRRPGLFHVEGQPAEIDRWSFVMLPMDAMFFAALAVEGHGWTLQRSSWDHLDGGCR
jgi:4'-phosphopantetheinyl transferase